MAAELDLQSAGDPGQRAAASGGGHSQLPGRRVSGACYGRTKGPGPQPPHPTRCQHTRVHTGMGDAVIRDLQGKQGQC